MGKVCVGIDVGGTTVKLGLFETTGRLMDKWEIAGYCRFCSKKAGRSGN